MFGQYSYDGIIKKYVDIFGAVFNDVYIERTNGTTTQRQLVPIEFSPVDKEIVRNDQDPLLERPIAIQLPRMGYELMTWVRNPSRQLNSVNELVMPNDTRYPDVRYVPVAYDFIFQLTVKSKNLEDTWKVAEQILPYFSPTLTIKADLLGNGTMMDVPITLNQFSGDDVYQGRFEDRRKLEHTYTFTITGWIFGPEQGGINGQKYIRWVDTQANLWDGNTNNMSNTTFVGSNTYISLANTAIGDIQPTDPYDIIIIPKEHV